MVKVINKTSKIDIEPKYVEHAGSERKVPRFNAIKGKKEI